LLYGLLHFFPKLSAGQDREARRYYFESTVPGYGAAIANLSRLIETPIAHSGQTPTTDLAHPGLQASRPS
jgi:hypothetical protein